jgi:hypothetical protein
LINSAYSAALSIKMNILLFLPAFLYLSVLSKGTIKTIRHTLIIAAFQVGFFIAAKTPLIMPEDPNQPSLHARKQLRIPQQRLSVLPRLPLPMDRQLALPSCAHLQFEAVFACTALGAPRSASQFRTEVVAAAWRASTSRDPVAGRAILSWHTFPVVGDAGV